QRRELTNHAILVVGRGDDCDLRLSDPSVSRIHARITLIYGRVYLEDAGSRWGTLVNNRPTENGELFPGDCLGFGDTQIRLELESPLVETIAPIHKRILQTLTRRPKLGRNVTKDRGRGAADAPTICTPAPQSKKKVDIAELVGKKFLHYR